MNEAQEALLKLRDGVAKLPALEQERVREATKILRCVMEIYEVHGLMALALIGAEATAA